MKNITDNAKYKTQYIINGLFLTQQVTGIQRYAREICVRLDELVQGKDLSVLVPAGVGIKDCQYKNMKVIPYGKHKGIAWEQIDLSRYVRKHGLICINFCNSLPLGTRPGITVIHDLMFKLHPSYFTTIRNKESRIWHTFLADYALRHERWIVTPSRFSKKEIEKVYPNAAGRVIVIPNGWQHVKKYKENEKWQMVYPYLKPGEYFFSLATRARNKNGKWLYQAAEKNPNDVFAVAGRNYDDSMEKVPDNLYFLGYIPDEDVCSLIKNCKAFLFPSLYEGFGIPPLEALALGAKVAVAESSSLPEVFGKSAHYVNPHDASVDLDNLLKEDVEKAGLVLQRFSWDMSARRFYYLLYKNKKPKDQ